MQCVNLFLACKTHKRRDNKWEKHYELGVLSFDYC
jgi:hypothetical protein